MKLSISHDTVYHYDEPVRSSIQYLRLTPQLSERQTILEWNLVLPKEARVSSQVDPFGNILHVLTLDVLHRELRVHATGKVLIDTACDSEQVSDSLLPYLRSTALTEPDESLRQFALRHAGSQPDRESLIRLMQALREHMAYVPGLTQVESTAAEAFAGNAGVCQDYAHVFLACVRSLGLPARYVSGYLLADEEGHLTSHAWVEVGLGDRWFTFDVASGLSRPERHLKLAVGMDYMDACPVRGMRRGGGFEQMHAHVVVSPLETDLQ